MQLQDDYPTSSRMSRPLIAAARGAIANMVLAKVMHIALLASLNVSDCAHRRMDRHE